MPKPGDLLDHRYEIVSILGEGGFATVYRARHVVLLSDHAIKVLHPLLAEDPELRTRFLVEGRIQARIKHPNIVRVTEVVTSPHAGLVMDFVDGETLSEFVKKRGERLDIATLGRIFLPIVDAMAVAHASGVVHRDLKPDNVLITKGASGDPEPRLTDFGIAKVINENLVGSAKQKTRTGIRMGTLHYMSPEQVRGTSDVDARTDVFALGAILYELITGRAAFAADSEFDTMSNIVAGKYEAPERLVADIQPALATCIRTALNPDRAKRFQDCRSFAAELRRAHDGVNAPAIRKDEARSTPAAKPSAPPSAARRVEPAAAVTGDDAAARSALYRRLNRFRPPGIDIEPEETRMFNRTASLDTPAKSPPRAPVTMYPWYCPKCGTNDGKAVGTTWHCNKCDSRR